MVKVATGNVGCHLLVHPLKIASSYATVKVIRFYYFTTSLFKIFLIVVLLPRLVVLFSYLMHHISHYIFFKLYFHLYVLRVLKKLGDVMVNL